MLRLRLAPTGVSLHRESRTTVLFNDLVYSIDIDIVGFCRSPVKDLFYDFQATIGDAFSRLTIKKQDVGTMDVDPGLLADMVGIVSKYHARQKIIFLYT